MFPVSPASQLCTSIEVGWLTDKRATSAVRGCGEQLLTILTKDTMGFTYDGVSVPLHRYTPVETTVSAVEPALDYFWRVHDFAQDCVNQGGISNVLLIQPPSRD